MPQLKFPKRSNPAPVYGTMEDPFLVPQSMEKKLGISHKTLPGLEANGIVRAKRFPRKHHGGGRTARVKAYSVKDTRKYLKNRESDFIGIYELGDGPVALNFATASKQSGISVRTLNRYTIKDA